MIRQEQLISIDEDVEEKNGDETEPFDPSKVVIQTKVQTVEGILRRIRQGTIRLSPDFQRNEIWKPTQRSRLIESLLLGIPIPMLYVSEDEKGNWDVIDGLQRLSTIRDFVLSSTDPQCLESKSGRFEKLTNLEFWTDLQGRHFGDLTFRDQNKILETQLSITVVSPRTPDEVKFTIFKRINTAGLVLKEQEIRNALYQGNSTTLLKKLAQSDEFLAAVGGKINDDRMQANELVLRMLAFLIRDYTYFSSKSFRHSTKSYTMDSFLADTMIIINSSPEFNDKKFKKTFFQEVISSFFCYKIDEVESRFSMAMERAIALFDEYAFRKATCGNRPVINKSLFDVWGSRLAIISHDTFRALMDNKELFFEKYNELLADEEFSNAVSRYGQYSYGVKSRYQKINSLIEEMSGERL